MVKRRPESDEKLIHIKFDYGELIESKRDILESQKSILKIIRSVQNYRLLRKKELKTHLQIYRNTKSLNFRVKKIQISIPSIKISKGIIPKKIFSNIKRTIPKYNDSIETELRNIQEKLAKLKS